MKMHTIDVFSKQTADRIIQAGKRSNRRMFMEKFYGLDGNGRPRAIYTVFYRPLQ